MNIVRTVKFTWIKLKRKKFSQLYSWLYSWLLLLVKKQFKLNHRTSRFRKRESNKRFQDSQKILAQFDYVKNSNKNELLEYYKVIREMIKNFNNMILDVSFKGGALLITIIAATTYLPIKEGIAASICSCIILIGALIICYNLEAQAVFFSNMMRVSIRIADNIEKLLLAVKDNNTGEFKIPMELLVTEKLKTDYPGKKYVVRRGKLFKYLKHLLYIYLVFTILKIFIDIKKVEIIKNYPIISSYIYSEEKEDKQPQEKKTVIENTNNYYINEGDTTIIKISHPKPKTKTDGKHME